MAGLQASGSSGLEYDCCSAGLQDLDVALLCKNKKEGEGGGGGGGGGGGVGEGFARGRSDA